MMASSDMTNRRIQQNRPVEDIHQPAQGKPTGYLPGLSSPLSRVTSSAADDDGVKSALSLACDFRRLRFSRNASFSRASRRSLADFPPLAPLSFPPSIVVNLLTVPAIVLALSCPIKVLPNQGSGEVFPAPG
jgi:hypothetical protein